MGDVGLTGIRVRLRVPGKSVKDLPELRGKDAKDSFRRRVAVTEEIKIARAAERLVEPRHQQYGPFQNETVGVTGLREPIEQALDRIVRQDQIEIQPLLLSYPKEACPNRGPDILGFLSHLRSAPRDTAGQPWPRHHAPHAELSRQGLPFAA